MSQLQYLNDGKYNLEPIPVFGEYFIKTISSDKRFNDYYSLIRNIKFYFTDAIDTACAGKGFIFLNKEFFNGKSLEEQKFIICHEMWHIILCHLDRGKNYNAKIYNIAADYVINLIVCNVGFDYQNLDLLIDMKYMNMSTGQVYKELLKDIPKTLNDASNTSHTSNEIIEELCEQVSEGESKNMSDIGIFIPSKNERIAVNYFKTPKELKADYKKIFRKYLVKPEYDYVRSFGKPNRRFNNKDGLILPGNFKKYEERKRLDHLVYAIDISGSVKKEDVTLFNESVTTIKKLLDPKTLTVVYFNHEIVFKKTFTDREKLEVPVIKPSGGTRIEPVYTLTEELNPTALAVFTDMLFKLPEQPKWDSIWLIPNASYKPINSYYGEMYVIPRNLT